MSNVINMADGKTKLNHTMFASLLQIHIIEAGVRLFQEQFERSLPEGAAMRKEFAEETGDLLRELEVVKAKINELDND